MPVSNVRVTVVIWSGCTVTVCRWRWGWRIGAEGIDAGTKRDFEEAVFIGLKARDVLLLVVEDVEPGAEGLVRASLGGLRSRAHRASEHPPFEAGNRRLTLGKVQLAPESSDPQHAYQQGIQKH